MEYTLEEIYASVGKDDRAVGLCFKHGSDAYDNFGEYINVKFIYTQKERELMDKLVENKPKGSHGYLKAEYLGTELDEKNVTLLNETGILSKDIQEILHSTIRSKNTFHSSEKRQITTVVIPFQSLPKGQDLDWMYGFRSKLVKENTGLSPQERAFYLAGKLYYEPKELTEEEKGEIYQKDGTLNAEIEWELLQIKHIRQEISEDEKHHLVEFYETRKKACSDKLDMYLQHAGSSLKKMANENMDKAIELMNKTLFFTERRLSNISENPIYLDLDSYLHIYMRHVEEFQVTTHFEEKDNFQWNEDDVFAVIQKVIEKVEEEYDDFRRKKPNNRFSKFADQSIYFEGDYYTLHIERNGRISTFHKNRKGHEKK